MDKVKNACEKAKATAPELAIDGEMQFDAAVSPVVGQQKFPGSKVAGHANTFIFPEIQSGTSAIRSPSAWAASPLTAPSSRA